MCVCGCVCVCVGVCMGVGGWVCVMIFGTNFPSFSLTLILVSHCSMVILFRYHYHSVKTSSVNYQQIVFLAIFWYVMVSVLTLFCLH